MASGAPDWYLAAWLTHFGKRQAALVHELGWDKARASFLYTGKQPYRRDIVNEVAAWLGLEPYELLMPPERALQYRRMQETARALAADDWSIAAETPRPWKGPPPGKMQAAAPAAKRTGTRG